MGLKGVGTRNFTRKGSQLVPKVPILVLLGHTKKNITPGDLQWKLLSVTSVCKIRVAPRVTCFAVNPPSLLTKSATAFSDPSRVVPSIVTPRGWRWPTSGQELRGLLTNPPGHLGKALCGHWLGSVASSLWTKYVSSNSMKVQHLYSAATAAPASIRFSLRIIGTEIYRIGLAVSWDMNC